MRRLIAAGLLPERAGQPVQGWVHITLADLLAGAITNSQRSARPPRLGIPGRT